MAQEYRPKNKSINITSNKNSIYRENVKNKINNNLNSSPIFNYKYKPENQLDNFKYMNSNFYQYPGSYINLKQDKYVNKFENKYSHQTYNQPIPYSQNKDNYAVNYNKDLKNGTSQIINNNELEIEIKFKYIKENSIYSEKAKKFEKLIDVIKRFEKVNCPPWMKNYLSNPTYNGQKVDPQKTLNEIGIKNSEIIEFIN